VCLFLSFKMPTIEDLSHDGLIPTHIHFKHNDLEFRIPLKANGEDWYYRSEDDIEPSGYGSELYIHLNFRELFIRLMHEQLDIQNEAEREVERERIEVMRSEEEENGENDTPPSYSPEN